MQLATWKASEFSFGLSSQPCWEKVKQQWVNHGFCVSGCSRGVLGLGSHSAVVCACGLSSIAGALLGWDLALAEVSLLPSWRCEGFPTAGQMGHLLPWHRVLTRRRQSPRRLPGPTGPLGAAAPCLCPHLLCLFSASSLWDFCARFCPHFALPHCKFWLKRGEWGQAWTNMRGKNYVALLDGTNDYKRTGFNFDAQRINMIS